MQTYIASSFAFGINVSWKKNGARRTHHELQIISQVPDTEWREYEENVMKYRCTGWLLNPCEGIPEINTLCLRQPHQKQVT